MSIRYARLWEDFWSSSLQEQPPFARLFFQSLWGLCDEEGNVTATMEFLSRRANLAPGDADLSLVYAKEAMAILTAPDPNSTNTEHEGRRVLAIAPNQWHLVSFVARAKRGDEDCRRLYWRERKREQRSEEKPPAKKPSPKPKPSTAASASASSPYTPEFEAFWDAWRRLGGTTTLNKRRSCLAYQKCRGRGATDEAILAGVVNYERYLEGRERVGKTDVREFVPMPETWLNQDRWQSEYPEEGRRGRTKAPIHGRDFCWREGRDSKGRTSMQRLALDADGNPTDQPFDEEEWRRRRG